MNALKSTLNVVFNVTYYLELNNVGIIDTITVIFYRVGILVFHNVQTTNLTFVG